jgi:hypothetical protein
MSSQGANNGPGQGAGQQFVKFSRQSAQRIAKVVRHVEQGDRAGPGIVFDHPQFSYFKVQIATYTGAWDIGQTKTVTLLNSTATVLVKNWCVPVTSTATESRTVLFCRASGTNSVVEIQAANTSTCENFVLGGTDLRELPGFEASEVQLLGHGSSACLEWYSVTTCTTATAA